MDVTIKLHTVTLSKDAIGNEVESIIDVEVPIIRIEKVYAGEFYKASQAGLRPSLRLVISTLNYNDQRTFSYDGNEYTVIRTEDTPDELTIIAERKLSE